MKMKIVRCFNCGTIIGEYENSNPRDYDHCGSSECAKEAQSAIREENAERYERAEADHFERYRY